MKIQRIIIWYVCGKNNILAEDVYCGQWKSNLISDIKQMFVFRERGKSKYQGKNFSEQRGVLVPRPVQLS